MKKILIIRFSSIGDIVLTSPVIRCLKEQMPGVVVHYLTKQQYAGILKPNPYIDKVIGISGKTGDGRDIGSIIGELKQQHYDVIIDLHKNLRSWRVIASLMRPWHSFSKLNFRKFLLTRFKLQCMPDIHIVDRYFQAVKALGVVNDGKGLDYFIRQQDEYPLTKLPETHQQGYVAVVIGAKHATKQLPLSKLVEVCLQLKKPFILLGGPEDKALADRIVETINPQLQPKLLLNLCGQLSLAQSASIIKQSQCVISHDTGLMHIAAAYKKPVLSVWGNTVPDLGMYPYFPAGTENDSLMMEVAGLSCRPCSKLGYNACPKGHFRCMMEQDAYRIATWANLD